MLYKSALKGRMLEWQLYAIYNLGKKPAWKCNITMISGVMQTTDYGQV